MLTAKDIKKDWEEKNNSGSAPKDVIYFGRVNFRNQNRLFGARRADRRQHTYVIGKTGVGKTSLLHNMVVQDIASGDGVCVVDPHGEFAEMILTKIPKERINDVIYFNPADPNYHIGFNVLEMPDPRYKNLVASGLMGIFTKIWSNVWSARMEYILNNTVLALLDTPGCTLLGITRMLVDKDYRQEIVRNIKDPVVKAFWINEFEQWQPQFRNEAIAPIQNKVGQFLSTSMVRNIVGQSKSTINILDIMNQKKIFIVNVSKGRIGEDNSALLGAMLITKIQLSAMERVRLPEEERADFFLYVDEFQNFATDSFANILSEARKYRLNLILAHQYIGQLITDVSTKVRDAVFGNVGTMIVFRVGAADAEFLEKEFEPEFGVQDMVNLPNYHIYIKLMVNGVTSRPFSAVTLPYFRLASSETIREQIIDISQNNYARPREEVESAINRWSGMLSASDEAPVGTGKFPAVCSNCDRKITVPFEPTPGRPVYCQDCLAKVKLGEIKPPAGYRSSSGKPPRPIHADLAGLGIEFEGRSRSAYPAPQKERSASQTSVKKKEEAESGPTISLKNLKKEEPTEKIPSPPPGREVDIAGLKDAINEALGQIE